MRTDLSRLRRPRIAAAVAAAAVAGVIGAAGVAGVAGAGETHTIFSVENGGSKQCFSISKKATCATGERVDLEIRTGDKVVWDFSGAGTMLHNAAPTDPETTTPSDPPNAAWDDRPRDKWQTGGTITWPFGEPGVYKFECTLHDSMVGTITVKGDPVDVEEPQQPEDPKDPDPPVKEDPPFQATIPPGTTPVPDDHVNTPAPGKAAKKDTEAPRLLRAQIKSVKQGAKLRFWVSEPANVEVTVRRGKSVVTSARLHVAAGTRSVVVRSSRLRKRGTYTVQWRAVDAMANKSNVAKKTLKVK